MESILTLNLKKRLTMRSYQETVVTDIINNFGLNKPYILGSCPSSGKTEMAIEAMIRLIESGKIDRVLILAHSTNALKTNFYNRLIQYFEEGVEVDVMRGQKDYNYNARIQVMIPQNITHIIGKFDLVIADEAQHNVLAEDGNYSKIIEMVEPKFQLLLTGTPSKFVLENNLATEDNLELPFHINTIGMDMVGFDHFHDVRFDLIKSAYGFTSEDYNRTQDLSTDVEFSFEETERTVNNVIIGVVRNIALRNGTTLSKNSDFVLEGRKLIQSGKFGKTLIMCRSIDQANQISEIISRLFEVDVMVSESKNDIESINLGKFKDNEFNFLCVVNRARQGYDDNKLVNLIDITMTHNIDLIYQMFCRVVRLDKTNPKAKLYIKVTSNAEGMPDYTMNIMTAALMLGATENLTMFNGRNFRGLVMPRIERDGVDEDDVIVDGLVDIVDIVDNIVRRRQINDIMALDLIQMFINDGENLICGNDRYAMTTLGESLVKLGGKFMSPEDTFNICVDNELTSENKYDEYRKVNKALNLYSTPYLVTKESSGNYFKRVRDELGINDELLSPEDTFKLCVDNELINSTKYKVYRNGNEELNLNANPWRSVKESHAVYFKRVKKELDINDELLSPEDTFKLCIDNELINSTKYKVYRNECEELNLRSTPWIVTKESIVDYFKRVRDKLGINDEFMSPEDTFKLCIDNELISENIYKKYRKGSEELNLYSAPYLVTKESSGNYFKRVRDELGINDELLSPEDTFKLCIDNELISNTKYSVYRKGNKELNLHSGPWAATKESCADYFKRVRGELRYLLEETGFIMSEIK